MWGHTTDACYVNGNKEKPMKKDYNTPPPRRQRPNPKGEESNSLSNKSRREGESSKMDKRDMVNEKADVEGSSEGLSLKIYT